MAAVAGCSLISFAYVGVLYVWHGLPRDHPCTIKRRLMSILLVCGLTWMPAWLLARHICGRDRASFFMSADGEKSGLPCAMLGFRTEGLLAATLIPLGLTATLFAGPLLLLALDAAESTRRFSVMDRHWLMNARDFVAAPLTEEWAFRACMLPLLGMEGWSTPWMLFINPLFFGAAHAHHVYEMVRFQGIALNRALAAAGFQMAYTMLFGWLASWMFIRTGHLAAPVVSHAFCNAMGFPDFWRILNHRRRRLLVCALAGGVIAFFACIVPLTEPGLYGWHPHAWRKLCIEEIKELL